MQLTDFDFDLPDEQIARFPLAERSQSRLLCLNGEDGAIEHRIFKDIIDKVQPGDLMVFNDTRVIPARLFGQKASGGKVEVLIERVQDASRALAHLRASRSPKVGAELILAGEVKATVVGRQDRLFELEFAVEGHLIDVLEEYGSLPLPPYMEREEQSEDKERYQTVYNNKPGAVAAPTAGLHFDDALMQALDDKGVEKAFVTLHVGAGTFLPVKVDKIEDHHMHSEYIEVSEQVCEQVRATKARGGRVFAVGTTSVRCLETASQSGEIQPFMGDTDIFIYPGYRFKTVDRLITNFHLPQSTLLMLVSAFVGYEEAMNAYRVAVAEKYRFFSYGDAMLLTPKAHAPE